MEPKYEFLDWIKQYTAERKAAYKEAKFAGRDYGYLKSEAYVSEVVLANYMRIFGIAREDAVAD